MRPRLLAALLLGLACSPAAWADPCGMRQRPRDRADRGPADLGVLPSGMDGVCQQYVEAGRCFVAVKTRVGRKDRTDPRPGQQQPDPGLKPGETFSGHVQALAEVRTMVLTVIDGDFPREVVAEANLTFSPFTRGEERNNRREYDVAQSWDEPRAERVYLFRGKTAPQLLSEPQ